MERVRVPVADRKAVGGVAKAELAEEGVLPAQLQRDAEHDLSRAVDGLVAGAMLAGGGRVLLGIARGGLGLRRGGGAVVNGRWRRLAVGLVVGRRGHLVEASAVRRGARAEALAEQGMVHDQLASMPRAVDGVLRDSFDRELCGLEQPALDHHAAEVAVHVEGVRGRRHRHMVRWPVGEHLGGVLRAGAGHGGGGALDVDRGLRARVPTSCGQTRSGWAFDVLMRDHGGVCLHLPARPTRRHAGNGGTLRVPTGVSRKDLLQFLDLFGRHGARLGQGEVLHVLSARGHGHASAVGENRAMQGILQGLLQADALRGLPTFALLGRGAIRREAHLGEQPARVGADVEAHAEHHGAGRLINGILWPVHDEELGVSNGPVDGVETPGCEVRPGRQVLHLAAIRPLQVELAQVADNSRRPHVLRDHHRLRWQDRVFDLAGQDAGRAKLDLA
mmetsp:Transcript_119250/g.342644  ORF Transcript_119250/g.342644 Transcript_119250/m.342644 type:complete len:446 (+) Transcript_119250:439-1776(+)